ncbi:hybrid sensor histidine kinase/response regulator transcription factor [Sediminibacterium soli]|uniref:hybrid sensor histidine kinase/response regulator transcription factor n=1 Tax=Sediminibacterium soli TaxID=2698829 RepID=UPI00137A0C1B|nr:two-component regulator propeller domain-containing protein [Sediminibacterium soli]NCI47712.1 response regulator [Sediminibacterium soli]
MLRCSVLCLLCLQVQLLFAGSPERVRYLGIEHGLSNNAVTCIYRDYQGFMWFGTYDGLNRYDGYGFKTFRNIIGDSSSLSDNHIYSVEGDSRHNIWVGGTRGISVYNPSTGNFFYPGFYLPGRVTPVYQTGGVPVIQRVDDTRIFAGLQDNGLAVFEKDKPFGHALALPGYPPGHAYTVNSIELDTVHHCVWFMVDGAGLYVYDLANNKIKLVSERVKQADCLKTNGANGLWIGTDNGLFLFNTDTHTLSGNLMPARNRVACLFRNKQGMLWIGLDGAGVWYLPPGSMQPQPYVSATGNTLVNSNAIYDFFEDSEGRKWVGTLRGGVNLIDAARNTFRSVVYPVSDKQGNAIENFILSFEEDRNRNIWIGTDGAGLRYWNRGTNSFTVFRHDASSPASLSSNFVTGIKQDSYHELWVATFFGGINRLKKNGTGFEHFTCTNPVTGAEENNAWVIYEDLKKKLWVSTTNNGHLYLFNRNSRAFEMFDERIGNIQCMAEDRAGVLWGGNYTSLIKIDPVTRKHRFFNIGYPVRSIHEDRNHRFWIGTEGGGLLLFDRNTGSFQRFTTVEGLPNNTILRLLEEPGGAIWLSTYNGLSKFIPGTAYFRNFSQSDGLQSNQFSFNAALALSSGEFLFGGIKGFNIFNPDSIYDHRSVPNIYLTGVRIDNQPAENDDNYITQGGAGNPGKLTLPYNKAILALDFVALEYSGAEKIAYAYKLEGWDQRWNPGGSQRTASYSRLEEGSYSFKVKMANPDGTWSGETTLLYVVVSPPWYRSWWAYLLYVLSFAGIVYLYIRYNSKQERLKYEIKLAHIENEKEKEIGEKRVSFFTHVAHEFRTPLTLIINPLKELLQNQDFSDGRKDISMVYRNARRLLSLTDQLLLFRKAESIDEHLRVEHFNMADTCKEVALSFSQHALSKSIGFDVHCGDEPVYIYGDREKIEIILFNLLSNACKYTPAGGRIRLALTERSEDLVASVEDSGPGIPAEKGEKIFESFYQAGRADRAPRPGFGIGLYVSSKLALAHQGKLGYTSEYGKGCRFELCLLKGKDHFDPESVCNGSQAIPTILEELVQEPETDFVDEARNRSGINAQVIDKLASELPLMVIVDDDADIRSYVRTVFSNSFTVMEAEDGSSGLELVGRYGPDIVVSDIMMKNMDGITLCHTIKADASLAHIPVILLTASSSEENRLKGFEGGAEDYLTKPFDKAIIVARVNNILRGRRRLKEYFFNAVTLKPNTHLAGEHKAFIETCIAIVEKHLTDPGFSIPAFCREIGMSHPSLYKKVKAVSGLTVNVFIRYLRLRKAAELLVNTDKTIVEVTYLTGFNDVRYFREQFTKLFGITPSEYVKRYRKVLGQR